MMARIQTKAESAFALRFLSCRDHIQLANHANLDTDTKRFPRLIRCQHRKLSLNRQRETGAISNSQSEWARMREQLCRNVCVMMVKRDHITRYKACSLQRFIALHT
jgi:hypothetical protein